MKKIITEKEKIEQEEINKYTKNIVIISLCIYILSELCNLIFIK